MANFSGVNYLRNVGAVIGQAVIDVFSGALRFVTSTHSEIHEGNAYEIEGVNGEGIVDDATLLIQFETPADKKMHLKNISAWIDAGTARLEIIEAPTHTTGSTGLTPINKERNTSNTSGVVAFSDPTGISGGTNIKDVMFGGGTGGNANGGAVSIILEDVLKIDSVYIFRLTNLSGGTADMNLLPFWYETDV